MENTLRSGQVEGFLFGARLLLKEAASLIREHDLEQEFEVAAFEKVIRLMETSFPFQFEE